LHRARLGQPERLEALRRLHRLVGTSRSETAHLSECTAPSALGGSQGGPAAQRARSP